MSVTFAELRPATVTLDGMIRDLPAYLPAIRWNGWECPYFRVADIRAHRASFDAYGQDVNESEDTVYRWDDATDLPSIVSTWEDEESEEAVSPITIDGVPCVSIGWASWVWSEQIEDGDDE